MALGKRIADRLDALEMTRNQLLDKVDGLTAQALSNLIVRDSRRSEWDELIADALGVSVMWLVYGKECTQTQSQTLNEPPAPSYQFISPQAQQVFMLMRDLSPVRQDEVLAFTRERITLQNSGIQHSTISGGQ